MSESRRRDLALFALAIGLRLLWLLDLSRLPFFDLPTSDSLFYASQAERILGGALLGTGLSYPSSPLYPYLVAPFFLLGGRAAFWAIYLAQALADAIGAVLLGRTAGALFGRAAAWIAGAGWAGYGLAVFYSGDLMEATAAAFLANLFAWLFLARQSSGLAGLALGAACLLRPHFLPVLAVAAGARALGSRDGRALRGLALFAAGAALPLGLSLARNVAVSGEPVLVSPYSGLNAYLGNHAGASGYLRVPPGKGLRNDVDLRAAARAYPEAIEGRALSEREISGFWWRETGREIASAPGGWAALMVRKLRLFWSSYEAPNHLDFYFFRAGSVALALAAVPFGLIAPLALVGLVLALARRIGAPGGSAATLAALTVTYALVSALFFVGDRFRLPATGWMLVLASGGVAWIAGAASGGRRRAAAAVAGAAVLLAVALHVPAPPAGGAREHVLVAASLAGRGRTADAERFLRRAVELEPGSAVARFNLGSHLARAGRLSEARAELEIALESAPDFPAAHALLGEIALREDPGAARAAAAHYREALRIEPYGRDARRIEALLAGLEPGAPLRGGSP